MKLEKELGGYSRWIVREYLSFRVAHGGATNAPDLIRDGKTGLVKSVVRTSAGLFTVTLNIQRPTVPRHIAVNVNLHDKNSPQTQPARATYVADSWNQSAGTFQVQVTDCNNTTPAAVDPDADSRISVELIGSISSVGQDAA